MEANKYESEFCGSIPITTINSIQAYGFLVVLDNNFIIRQVSENIQNFLFKTKDTFIGKSIGDHITEENFIEIKKKVSDKLIKDLPLYINFNESGTTQKFISLIHSYQSHVIIEFEPHEIDEIPYSEINYEINNIAGILRTAKNTSELTSFVCKEIKKISGFDRVLVYEFTKTWDGIVVAEEKNETLELETYLGLTFPASDIPRQARSLYHLNPFRYIPEINFTPAKLYPEINPEINGYTDLSTCNLRGVVPVHIEYLGNMNIGSSMSIRIIKNNELWGLISLHHTTPRKVSHQLRSSFEILTSIISSEISSRESENLLQERTRLDRLKNELLKKIHQDNFQSALLNGTQSLLSFLNLSGASFIYEGKIVSTENTLAKAQIEMILQWIQIQNIKEIYYTNHLPAIINEAKTFKDIACGIIVIPVNVDRNEFIIGFRPEIIKVRNWGGNPNEAIKYEADKKNYHPRNSFSVWKETVINTSEPWTALELEMAESFRHSLIEYILKIQTYKRIIAEEEAFKLSIVANNTTNLVLILDNQRKIEWANAAFLKTLNFSLDAIQGESFIYLFSSFSGIHEVDQKLNAVEHIYTPFLIDVVLNIKSKNIFVKLNFSPLLNEKKELLKYIIIGVDVTEIKEQANELKVINAQLERFAYLVSHDLKAPLKTIEGFSNLLESEIEEGKFKETKVFIGMIKASIKKMDTFISDILSYSRLSKEKHLKSKVNLNKMIDEIIQTLNPPSSYKIYIQPDLPELFTISLEIFQIFSNLLSNAFKYMNRPDGKIEVYYHILDENYLFTVKDNGPGIAPEYKGRIFEMFETVPAHRTKDSTGIGLASVKKLVEDKGGKIWVDSTPGDGSAFKFTLPIDG